MKKRCRNEVDQLHMFFQDWFTGAASPTEQSFARVAGVLAPEFQLISPRGVIDDRDSILASIRAAHGTRPDFQIRVENFTMRLEAPPNAIATYEEWQHDGADTRRITTVVLCAQAGTPNGLAWLHVHETWLAEPPVRSWPEFGDGRGG